ncbi:MAG: cell division protein FtsQ/DivIB [Lachnospiraceae bacterium]
MARELMEQIKKGKQKKWIIFIGSFLGILLFFAIFFYVFQVKSIIIEGNTNHTNEEIMDFIFQSPLDRNSIVLFLKYRNKGIEDIPFIERMDISILSPAEIKISVYEKTVSGFVEYLGKYMYFDREGIVVESSNIKAEGIPQIVGLKFNYMILHEKLPIENNAIFDAILSMSQLLTKNELVVDKIVFDTNNKITLVFDEIRINLGELDNIDDKLDKVKNILPELEGKSGVLRMDKYEENSKNITFEMD